MSEPKGSLSEPRLRRQATRRALILDVALSLAEAEGWDAVTTRRVADEIDFTQPVIYQHFGGRDELIRSIAVKGFELLAAELHALPQSTSQSRLEALCHHYVDFGSTRPRLYEAMFATKTTLAFASAETPAELRATFDAVKEVVALTVAEPEADSVAELVWASCHGIVTLMAAGRIPPDRVGGHIVRIAGLAAEDAHES